MLMHKKIWVVLLPLVLLGIGLAFYLHRRKQAAPLPNPAMSTLGHYLFFDTRLSFNGTKSCASCHAPQFAFTDGYRRSITATGDNVLHNAPSLLNIAKHAYFNWADSSITQLSQQHKRPLFNTLPIELGAKGNEALILGRLQADTAYPQLFKRAFPSMHNPINFENIVHSIAAYVYTLQSSQSPFDRYMQGDSLAIGPDARKGFTLFNSKRLGCNQCHGGIYFSNATLTKNTDSIYFNTGLYNLGNRHQYPVADNGLRGISGQQRDDGRFKVPSLRNVAITAPYMHDGSMDNLSEVIDMYMRGGRQITNGPASGDGAKNKYKSPLVKGFAMSPNEKQQLLSFLYALTDSTLFYNPGFQNPFAQTNN